eukprot:CAMPEP_0205820102 /NCGR_PEP_ID=MMETSP0206-20130828/2700_1 /ASSEMBLY_ACC=CAM_ASM_000279 /TAXON_ID=36767 /ORGANISM="Euplotes focardii, Strain TN1" /LENGTH=189 /DNA_ID=CAMNT_0053114491 /DNA_START=44 /DNA_END=613 /DNA_ORIENTATION=+
MEKTALIVLLLGIALVAYVPITDYFLPQNLKACSCGSIQDMVAWAEGNKPCRYFDSLGIPTIGIGFNLRRGDARKLITSTGANFDKVLSGSQCLSPAQVTQLFNNDLTWARAGAQSCNPTFGNHHQCIQNVLMDMTFNMGRSSLCGWPNFVAQIARKDYAGAASNMKGTKWCGQVGRRCTRNIDLVKAC